MAYRDWLHEWTRKDDLEKSWRKNADGTWLRRVHHSSKGKFFEEYAPDSFLERMRMCLWDFVESGVIISIIQLLCFLCIFVCLCVSVGLLGRWWLSVIF